MIVGILTASRTDNNGTDLQAFAMQRLFERSGCEAIIINYKCDKLENSRKVFYPISFKGLLNIPYQICTHIKHENFRKKYFKYSKQVYTKEDIKDINFDYIVVGSDQVWNLKITGNDLNFFLPFKTDAIKVSYAVSLGVLDLTEWECKYGLKRMLSDFKGISVRELSGVKALEKIGVDAVCSLDPLLMIESFEWNEIVSLHKENSPYIFVYTVDRTYEVLAYAKQMASKMNCKVIFYGNLLRPVRGVEIKRFSGIEEWLALLKNAELVITNSYHGLSFSVNFHKKFSLFWLKNSMQSNTRMESLLLQIGIKNYKDGMICEPDWEKIDICLKKQRSKSYQYIKEMLNDND